MNHYQSREEHEKVSAIMQQSFDKQINESEKNAVVLELVKRIKKRSIDYRIEHCKGDNELLSRLMMEKARLNSLKLKG